MLRMPGRKSRGYTRYSPAIPSPLFCFVYTLLRSEAGVQEQKNLDAFFDVEINDDQELTGGSQAGGLAFSVCVCYFVLAFLRQPCTLCLYSDTIVSADLCIIKLLYSSPRGPWLVIYKLVLFLFVELCCDISIVAP